MSSKKAPRDYAKLLEKAQSIFAEATGFISKDDLRTKLGCRRITASKIHNELGFKSFGQPQQREVAPSTDGRTLTETDDIAGDKRTISLPKTGIHTLEELLEFCKVDTSVWEVERFVVNKWEMGYIAQSHKVEHKADAAGDKETDTENTSGSQPLYQVKAFLRKRYANDVDGYVAENARLRSQLAKQRLDSARVSRYAKHLAVNHAGYDDLLKNVKEFVVTLGDFSLPVSSVEVPQPLTKLAVNPEHTEDAVLLLSDTHFGDRIKREDTSGFPEFDLVISGNRMGYVIRKAKQVLTLHRAMYPIKKLHVWIGGDIGNGVLHDSPNSNELFMPAQVHFSYKMLQFAIEDLLSLTVPDSKGNVVVEEIVLLFTIGNHMRLDEKMPYKYQAQRTLDWLIYQFVIEKFASHPKVAIRAEMSPYIFENIRGHRHLFAHGMQVGYKNSPDAQCKSMGLFIDRVRALFDSPEWRRKNNLQGETFARACIGDIHVPVSFPRLVSNGSLNGQNELGVNWTLEPIPAGMQLFGVSDKHIETWKYFLECSHIQRAQDDFNGYGTFAAEYAKRIGR